MLLSLALLFIVGLFLSKIMNILKLPSLVGYLLAGLILGPYGLNYFDESLLLISADLRKIALIIILLRAGFNLDLETLKSSKFSSLLLCFVPACFEIIACTLLGPIFFKITTFEAMLLGCVLAAVSPAVVIPKMIDLKERKLGLQYKIPETMMFASSLDDIFVILLFTMSLSLVSVGQVDLNLLFSLPSAIILGVLFGIIIGFILAKVFKKYSLRDSTKIIFILSISFILVTIEDNMNGAIGFSGLLAIMVQAITINALYPSLAKRLSNRFSKLWVASEIWLFVLVGATVNINYALKIGFLPIIFILILLIFRSCGVLSCLSLNPMPFSQKLFCCISYLPKATVQAAIGGIPLMMGLPCGELILSIAIVAIFVSAPIGALLIDYSATKLLKS